MISLYENHVKSTTVRLLNQSKIYIKITDASPASVNFTFFHLHSLHFYLEILTGTIKSHIKHYESNLTILFAASFVSSGELNVENLKYPSPQAPNPSPGVPTT